MQVLRKIKLYRNLMVLFIALNTFSLALGVVFTISFFTKKNELHSEFEEKSSLAEQYGELYHETQNLLVPLLSKKDISQEQWFKFWQVYTELQNPADSEGLTLDELQAQKNSERVEFFRTLAEKSYESQTSYLAKIQLIHDKFYSMHKEFIFVGLLTLVFGILLPSFMVFLFGKLLYKAKVELEKKILALIREFGESKKLYDKPFQSPEFWAKTISLVLENAALYTSHPGVHMSAELSRHIRLEIEKFEEKGTEDQT